MPDVPKIISPTSEGYSAADVKVIQVSGCDNDTGCNGYYTSDNANPPVYTQVADSAYTIEYGANVWAIELTGVSQFQTSYATGTDAPVSENVIEGTALTWSVTGGTGPAVPTSNRRTPVPNTLTP